MSKFIQAYFKTEDDAEGARSSLLPMNLIHLEVGRLDDNSGINSNNVLHPILPLGGTVMTGGNVMSAGLSTTSTIGVIPVEARNIEGAHETDESAEVDSVVGSGPTLDDDYGSLEYVLSAKVKDSDYEEIVHNLRSQGAYVEKRE